MRINTKVVFEWDKKTGEYKEVLSEGYDYTGEIAHAVILPIVVPTGGYEIDPKGNYNPTGIPFSSSNTPSWRPDQEFYDDPSKAKERFYIKHFGGYKNVYDDEGNIKLTDEQLAEVTPEWEKQQEKHAAKPEVIAKKAGLPADVIPRSPVSEDGGGEYGGVTQRQWELLGGIGTKAIGGLIGAGIKYHNKKKEEKIESDRVEAARAEQERLLQEDERLLQEDEREKAEKKAKWKAEGLNRARNSQWEEEQMQSWENDIQMAEDAPIDDEWPGQSAGAPPEPNIYAHVKDIRKRQLTRQVQARKKREDIKKAMEDNPEDYKPASIFPSKVVRGTPKYTQHEEEMDLVTPDNGALGAMAKQSLHNKVKEKYGRIITRNREKGDARELKKRLDNPIYLQDTPIEKEEINYASEEPQPLPPPEEINYVSEESPLDAMMTKKYWEEDQEEFKDLGGQYRILDPTDKYKDVEANPQGKWDQQMKAWLMRKATRRMTGKKWYQKQNYKYDWT
jgi:hypothetical protein